MTSGALSSSTAWPELPRQVVVSASVPAALAAAPSVTALPAPRVVDPTPPRQSPPRPAAVIAETPPPPRPRPHPSPAVPADTLTSIVTRAVADIQQAAVTAAREGSVAPLSWSAAAPAPAPTAASPAPPIPDGLAGLGRLPVNDDLLALLAPVFSGSLAVARLPPPSSQGESAAKKHLEMVRKFLASQGEGVDVCLDGGVRCRVLVALNRLITKVLFLPSYGCALVARDSRRNAAGDAAGIEVDDSSFHLELLALDGWHQGVHVQPGPAGDAWVATPQDEPQTLHVGACIDACEWSDICEHLQAALKSARDELAAARQAGSGLKALASLKLSGSAGLQWTPSFVHSKLLDVLDARARGVSISNHLSRGAFTDVGRHTGSTDGLGAQMPADSPELLLRETAWPLARAVLFAAVADAAQTGGHGALLQRVLAGYELFVAASFALSDEKTSVRHADAAASMLLSAGHRVASLVAAGYAVDAQRQLLSASHEALRLWTDAYWALRSQSVQLAPVPLSALCPPELPFGLSADVLAAFSRVPDPAPRPTPCKFIAPTSLDASVEEVSTRLNDVSIAIQTGVPCLPQHCRRECLFRPQSPGCFTP